ncbi:phage minor head protein [Oceanobacter sp. 4_MG-2023]|uniref:phage head morphogenesis protein n=1 Tax=Oceanobacter sp. 4_MG-2023 TaxID=3062623 RepID=UPI002733BD1D|nr:phage minor head protein [Oceanobacter sp. 4_MG-2023]MDP2548076.1 phage minor head protein [Oceanobacter sp. 4_MG-2023]
MPTSNMATIDLGYAISLPPADAIAYFESKGYAIGWNWQDVWQEKHAQAFTTAKVARLDILQTLRDGILKVLKEGLTEQSFVRAVTPELKKAGWWGVKYVTDNQGNTEVVQEGSPHRLKTIYRTNLQTSYQAGRYQQQLDNAKDRPYWQYIAIRDSRTRPGHRKFHGKVFRCDDPIWQWLYPPNDWGCRCRVRALTAKQVEQMGLTVDSSEGHLITEHIDVGTNPRTGEVFEQQRTRYDDGKTKLTPGAGWSYNVGQAANQWQEQLLRQAQQKLDALPLTFSVQLRRLFANSLG